MSSSDSRRGKTQYCCASTADEQWPPRMQTAILLFLNSLVMAELVNSKPQLQNTVLLYLRFVFERLHPLSPRHAFVTIIIGASAPPSLSRHQGLPELG